MFTVKNAHTGEILTQTRTLTDARHWCDQRLHRAAGSREEFLSNLAAGIIAVYNASATEYRGPGF